MLEDTVLTALLADNKSIFRTFPATTLKKPFLIIQFPNMNPQVQITKPGVYRPNVTWDIIVIDPFKAPPIFVHLQDNWSIPLTKPEGVSSTNYSLTKMQFDDMIEVPGVLEETDGGQHVRQFSVPTSMRIVKLTT